MAKLELTVLSTQLGTGQYLQRVMATTPMRWDFFDSGADAGYSIDAPEFIPGGSCHVHGADDEWRTSQWMVQRESN